MTHKRYSSRHCSLRKSTEVFGVSTRGHCCSVMTECPVEFWQFQNNIGGAKFLNCAELTMSVASNWKSLAIIRNQPENVWVFRFSKNMWTKYTWTLTVTGRIKRWRMPNSSSSAKHPEGPRSQNPVMFATFPLLLVSYKCIILTVFLLQIDSNCCF